uniref:Sulfatase N-terminal domain-containing protein n=1 Tax=Lotharella globosa TaxID=91324 RepID=A0A7S4DS85_9EUKA
MERRRLGPVLLALACVALPPESRNSVPPAKYILHIVIDDLGWGDAWGTSHTHTPNLDELARGGVSLERLYATPMCAPSRASMFTGRHPADIGYYRNPSEDARLPPDCEHLPSHLRKLGFSSHLIGKWHLPWHSPDQVELVPTPLGLDATHEQFSSINDPNAWPPCPTPSISAPTSLVPNNQEHFAARIPLVPNHKP